MGRCQGRRGPVFRHFRFHDADAYSIQNAVKFNRKTFAVSHDLQKTSAWNDYRLRRRWFFYVWLGGSPVVILSGILLKKVFHSSVPFYVVGGACLISFAIVGVRLTLFRCPLCRRPFFCTWLSSNHFAKRCVHCGLPKWAEPESGGDRF